MVKTCYLAAWKHTLISPCISMVSTNTKVPIAHYHCCCCYCHWCQLYWAKIGSFAVPEDWEVPEGWSMETNSWIQGYGVPDRHLAAGANCTRTPFSGAPWQLPTKDTLLIGAEYFDGK
jgi:hypothetical protein